jgi:hypothetical protein
MQKNTETAVTTSWRSSSSTLYCCLLLHLIQNSDKLLLCYRHPVGLEGIFSQSVENGLIGEQGLYVSGISLIPKTHTLLSNQKKVTKIHYLAKLYSVHCFQLVSFFRLFCWLQGWINPAISNTCLAALLICRNLSWPRWMPPYQRVTTTSTFWKFKICKKS